jgi:hypothetical protein
VSGRHPGADARQALLAACYFCAFRDPAPDTSAEDTARLDAALAALAALAAGEGADPPERLAGLAELAEAARAFLAGARDTAARAALDRALKDYWRTRAGAGEEGPAPLADVPARRWWIDGAEAEDGDAA